MSGMVYKIMTLVQIVQPEIQMIQPEINFIARSLDS
jgi:hypothetical protein